MKMIIKGKKYDTDTATMLASGTNGSDWSDYSKEGLFQKRTGEFFLCGEGAPYSKYGEPCGTNAYTSGSGIIPISEEEAKDWCVEHLDVDDYEKIFGEVEE